MTVSILIVNWKSKDYLRQCLCTVRATCGSIFPQIVVVDGASFDGCAEMLATEFPEVEFVQSRENIGFGRSNNLGFARVSGEALLLLNPDTELRENAVSLLLKHLEELPGAGILGVRLLNSDGSLQTSCVQSLPTPLNQALASESLRRLFPNSRLWGISALRQSAPSEVEAVSGACMMMRSETFRQVAGFNPDYFMYGEDMDLCARIRHLGLKVYHLPMVEIIHHGGRSSTGVFSKRTAVCMRASVHRFIRAHQGAGSALGYRFLMSVSSLVRLALLLPGCLGPQDARRTAEVSIRSGNGRPFCDGAPAWKAALRAPPDDLTLFRISDYVCAVSPVKFVLIPPRVSSPWRSPECWPLCAIEDPTVREFILTDRWVSVTSDSRSSIWAPEDNRFRTRTTPCGSSSMARSTIIRNCAGNSKQKDTASRRSPTLRLSCIFTRSMGTSACVFCAACLPLESGTPAGSDCFSRVIASVSSRSTISLASTLWPSRRNSNPSLPWMRRPAS